MSDSLWPVDCSPPNSSIHGILQARILEWVATSFSRVSSRLGERTQVSHIAGKCFNLCVTKEALCIRHLMGQPLYCSAVDAGCGKRQAMVMAPPPMHDSAVSPCFHGCPAFLHRCFPPQSPSSHPFDLSFHSQQQPSPWGCSTIPKLRLAAAAPSRGPVSLSGVCLAAARTVWFSFHLGCHRSAVSLSALNVSPLTQTIAPCRDWTTASVPPPTEGRSSPTNTPVFPPSSFILQSFVWFYIFFSTGQVLLSAISLCPACTSLSEGIFLMCLWRQIYSMFTCSSIILFSFSHLFFFFNL